jgi:hypothetical protein
VPWQDQSGDTLRVWLGVDAESFYDTTKFALVPMGFCYPGSGNTGDLPPRPECAPLWHERLLAGMKDVQLILLIGQYSRARYLSAQASDTLTETVRRHRDFLPRFLPLPHPSPRNRIWLRRNPWFEAEVIPELRKRVARILGLYLPACRNADVGPFAPLLSSSRCTRFPRTKSSFGNTSCLRVGFISHKFTVKKCPSDHIESFVSAWEASAV